ncbi:MAG: hypothetical protein AB7E70_06300 [Hyphomicrobiaceae bacterium]
MSRARRGGARGGSVILIVMAAQAATHATLNRAGGRGWLVAGKGLHA